MIRRVKYKEIDLKKYQHLLENCVQNSDYAEPSFLNIVTNNKWEILVYGNYDAVMPIPYIKKLGFKLVIMPVLALQLGVFSKEDNKELNQKFLNTFLKSYFVISYNFNSNNTFNSLLKTKISYLIENRPYEEIKNNYSTNRRRNIRITESIKDKVVLNSLESINGLEDFMIKNMKGVSNLSSKQKYVDICKSLLLKKKLKIQVLYFKNQLQSIGIFYIGKNRNYLSLFINDYPLLNVNIPSIQIDQFLQKNIHSKEFDFVGSNIQSIAEFNSRFGAIPYEYSVVEKSLLKNIFLFPFKKYIF